MRKIKFSFSPVSVRDSLVSLVVGLYGKAKTSLGESGTGLEQKTWINVNSSYSLEWQGGGAFFGDDKGSFFGGGDEKGTFWRQGGTKLQT